MATPSSSGWILESLNLPVLNLVAAPDAALPAAETSFLPLEPTKCPAANETASGAPGLCREQAQYP